jgi:hypothetical protein
VTTSRKRGIVFSILYLGAMEGRARSERRVMRMSPSFGAAMRVRLPCCWRRGRASDAVDGRHRSACRKIIVVVGMNDGVRMGEMEQH